MILTILLSVTIFQGVVLAIVVFKSPLFKSKANNYLSYAILSLSVLLLNLVLEINETDTTTPLLQLLDNIGLEFLVPVFIFLFIAHQVNHPIKRSHKTLWLYIPFVIQAVVNIFSDLNTPDNLYKVSDLMLQIIAIFEFLDTVLVLIFIPGVLLSAFPLIKYSQAPQERRWLTYIWIQVLIFFLSFPLTIFFYAIFLLFYDYDIIPFVMKVLAIFATFLIHWTVYNGIFKFRLAKDQEEIKALFSRKKSANHHLIDPKVTQHKPSEEEKAEPLTKENIYFKKLEDLCINQHIYRDSSLDRDKVAEKLGISAGYVSQLVNTITGDNFSTYINRYRVEAVKEIILDPEFAQYSLLAMGLECGFSSKTTFHNSFKKFTGMTPNTYRKMHK